MQTPTIVRIGGETIALSYLIYMGLIMLGRQIHTAEPLVPERSAFEFELAIES